MEAPAQKKHESPHIKRKHPNTTLFFNPLSFGLGLKPTLSPVIWFSLLHTLHNFPWSPIALCNQLNSRIGFQIWYIPGFLNIARKGSTVYYNIGAPIESFTSYSQYLYGRPIILVQKCHGIVPNPEDNDRVALNKWQLSGDHSSWLIDNLRYAYLNTYSKSPQPKWRRLQHSIWIWGES